MEMQNQAVSVLLVVCQLMIHFVTMSKLSKTTLILRTSPPPVRYIKVFLKMLENLFWQSFIFFYQTVKFQVVTVYLAVF